MTCPVPYDQQLTPAESCPLLLRELHDAYMQLSMGKRAVRVRGADYREVEYAPGDIGQVVKLYNYYYAMCGAGSGYPDLSAIHGASVVGRGGPAYIGGLKLT